MKLELITIASPCTVSWEGMSGDDRVRHCAQCHLDVYDLSALTRAQAEEVIRENGDSLCVRYLQRPDGTVITQDCATLRTDPPMPCAPRPPAPQKPQTEARGMAAKGKPRPEPRHVKMGKMLAPPPDVVPDVIDERLTADTVLADIVRAVRAASGEETRESTVHAVEHALTVPETWKRASCPSAKKCPIWLPVDIKRLPDDIDEGNKARLRLVATVTPMVQAAFDEARAAKLLRELARLCFYAGIQRCPHCNARAGDPDSPF